MVKRSAGWIWESRLKVLYFSRDFSPHDERFLTALSRTENEIYFLRSDPQQTVTLPSGVNELRFSSRVSSSLAADNNRVEELKTILHELKPDILHAGPLHGPAYIAAQTGFSPLVSMSWGADILNDGEVDQDIKAKIQFTLYNTTVLACDCQAVIDKAVLSYGYPRQRIYSFPWGVDLDHFSPQGMAILREKLGWQKNFVFLSNRSFEPIYGVDVTLRAFIKAAATDPNLRLLLLGKGKQESLLKEMVSQDGLREKIHFGGYLKRAELPDAYRSADLFVSASHCDGSSVSLMEALACGTPALVSDIPGNLEWVSHAETGWLFSDGDEDALTESMLSASAAQDLSSMRTHARSLAVKKADWSRNFNVLLEAYDQAVDLSVNSLNHQPGVR